MTQSFFKIPTDINIPNTYFDGAVLHQKYEKVQKYAKNYNGGDYELVPLETYHLLPNVVTLMLEQLPPDLLKIETPLVFLLRCKAPKVDKPVLPPHVDYKRLCAINVYLKTQGGKTYFYEWEPIKGSCKPNGCFTATDRDVWLLDTTKPHSAQLEPDSELLIITYSFSKTSFEDVAQYFYNWKTTVL